MRLEGPGLELVRESLGLIGTGAQITEFPDGVADQVVDVGALIRRGRTPVGTQGIFTFGMSNVHAAGGDILSVSMNPYDTPQSALAVGYTAGESYGPWPQPVPTGLDVWLLSAWLVASADVLTSAILLLSYPAAAMGLQLTETALVGELPTGVAEPYAMWTATTNFPSFARIGTTPSFIQRSARRLRRGAVGLRFGSTASAAGTLSCFGTLGLFAAGMGQDAQ